MMVDFRGAELQIGDPVAYIDGYNGGKIYLSQGTVTGFTPTMVKVGKYTNVKPARVTKLEV